MSIQALPYILLTGFFFGSTLIASRFSVEQVDPVTYVAIRLGLASLGFMALYLLPQTRYRWPRDRALWRHGLLLGVLATAVPMLAFVAALLYLSSGVTSVMTTTGPALTVIAAHFLLPGEQMTMAKGGGVSLALSGALLLALRGESGLETGPANPLGYLLVVGALISITSGTIYARRYMRGYDSFDVASIQTFVAALVTLPLGAWLFGLDTSGMDGRGVFALLYAAATGTFAAMMLYFYIIRRFGATPAALVSYVVPAVAAVGGVVVLGEQITSGMLLGMGIIAAGLVILNRSR